MNQKKYLTPELIKEVLRQENYNFVSYLYLNHLKPLPDKGIYFLYRKIEDSIFVMKDNNQVIFLF